jgi:hypothetical protein
MTFPATARHSNSSNATTLPDLVGQGLLTLVCTALMLRLWKTDLRVPFNYQADTLFELALTKSIADGGWIWFIGRLGAPFGLDIVAFPQNLTASSLIMKVIAIFTSEPGLILNAFWIIAIVLTSMVSHTALRSLGVSRYTSIVCSVLYALMPHSIYRNVAHISLTYIFIPVIAAFAIEHLAHTNRDHHSASNHAKISTPLLIFSCIAIGLDYIYNAFFSCFFLVCAGAIAAIHAKEWGGLKRIALPMALITGFAAINLVPTLLSWQTLGLPPDIGYKNPAEAEIYGLKIRHVVSPVFTNVLNNAHFPLENENQYSKLGLIGAIGFLSALVYGILGPARSGSLRWASGVLIIAGTLLATVGGFGAIFNVLISPDIRAYNRIIVFLGFFAFFVMATQLDSMKLFLKHKLSHRFGANFLPVAITLPLMGVLLLGLADQDGAARHLTDQYSTHEKRAQYDRTFVTKIEQAFPLVEKVYQLPETPFPPDPGRERMKSYDHVRPYLWSQRMHWSWPNFSRDRSAWSKMIGTPGSQKFVNNLSISGFSGLWLDRFAYTSKELNALEIKLNALLGSPLAISDSGRYALYSLVETGAQLRDSIPAAQIQEMRNDLLEPTALRYESGFYSEEFHHASQNPYRWSQKNSSIKLLNPSSRIRSVEFTANVHSSPKGLLRVTSNDQSRMLDLKNGSTSVKLLLDIPPKGSILINFEYIGEKFNAPRDSRELYFSIINPTIVEVN